MICVYTCPLPRWVTYVPQARVCSTTDWMMLHMQMIYASLNNWVLIPPQVEKGVVNIIYCPTDKMVSDFMTKPVQGTKYKTFEREIMGLTFNLMYYE